MEKYSKWKDPATGIHPFLENRPKIAPQSVVSKVLQMIPKLVFVPILFVVRVLFLTTLLVWYGLFELIALLIPISFLRRAIQRYSHFISCRLALFALGFHFIHTRVVNPEQPHRKLEEHAGRGIRSGDIIFSNCTSYVQLLYLSFRFSPVFTTLIREGDSVGYAKPRSLLGAIYDLISDTVPTKSETIPLKDIVQMAINENRGPVIVFPEATTSNGIEILKFIPCITTELLKSKPNFHVVSFKFENSAHSPAYTVGNPWIHFFFLLTQLNQTMKVHYATQSSINPPSTLVITDRHAIEFTELVSLTMGRLFQMHRALIGAKEKAEFLKFYHEKENIGYKKGV